MGNVASRPDEGASLHLLDQDRCESLDVSGALPPPAPSIPQLY